MMRRAIAVMSILSGAVLSGCTGIPSMPSFSVPKFNMPSFSMPGFNQPGMPVHVSSIPPGAEASFGTGGESCRTPCTLAAPNGTGTYNVSFTLDGYQTQSVPVHIAVNDSGSLQTGLILPLTATALLLGVYSIAGAETRVVVSRTISSGST